MKIHSLCMSLFFALASASCADAPAFQETALDELSTEAAAPLSIGPAPQCKNTFPRQPGPDAFLDSIPQNCFRLPSGYEAQLPFKYWGARSLVFVGTADLETTRAMLNPMGYEPLDLFGVEKAAVGFIAIDYEGTSAGPIKPIYFFVWTTGKLTNPSCYDALGQPLPDPTCAPGMLFSEHYFANTDRAHDVGIDLWGVPKTLATNETSLLGDIKSARTLLQGKEWLRLKWNRAAHPELVETRFQMNVWTQTPPEPHFASSNYVVNTGFQLADPNATDPARAHLVPYAPTNGDEVAWNPTTALGRTLSTLDFNPARDGGVWIHGTNYRGVMHDQVFSQDGPVLNP